MQVDPAWFSSKMPETTETAQPTAAPQQSTMIDRVKVLVYNQKFLWFVGQLTTGDGN